MDNSFPSPLTEIERMKMTPFSTKTVALAAAIALGSLMSSAAQAAILHTADGAAVMTKEGTAVLVDENFDICAGRSYAADTIVYFDFNKSGLTKQYKDQLTRFASEIKSESGKTISIVGYADRIGNAAYNEKLALKRAKNVRDFLVAKGVKAKKIEVRSLGDSSSRTSCDADLSRAKMISCLAEDRRVEIEVK